MKYIKVEQGQTNTEKIMDITSIPPFYFEAKDRPDVIISGHTRIFTVTLNYTGEVSVMLLKYTIIHPSQVKYKWSDVVKNVEKYTSGYENVIIKTINIVANVRTDIPVELKLPSDDIIRDYQYLYKVRIQKSDNDLIYKETDYFMMLSRKSI